MCRICVPFLCLCVARHKLTQNHAEPTAFAVSKFSVNESENF